MDAGETLGRSLSLLPPQVVKRSRAAPARLPRGPTDGTPHGDTFAAAAMSACSSLARREGWRGATPAANKGFSLTLSTKPRNHDPVSFLFPSAGCLLLTGDGPKT